jgi:hypothetical protein
MCEASASSARALWVPRPAPACGPPSDLIGGDASVRVGMGRDVDEVETTAGWKRSTSGPSRDELVTGRAGDAEVPDTRGSLSLALLDVEHQSAPTRERSGAHFFEPSRRPRCGWTISQVFSSRLHLVHMASCSPVAS